MLMFASSWSEPLTPGGYVVGSSSLSDFEAGLSGGCADQVDDLLITDESLAAPVEPVAHQRYRSVTRSYVRLWRKAAIQSHS